MEKISPYSRKMWTIEGLFSTGGILTIAVDCEAKYKVNIAGDILGKSYTVGYINQNYLEDILYSE